MKKLFLTLILPLLSLTIAANPITQSEALNIAKRMTVKMHKPSVALNLSTLQNEVKDRSGQRMAYPPFYAFNLENDNGFVIVAGDDNFPSILGYSDEGALPDSADELPCCLKFFLESYSEFVDDVRTGKTSSPMKAHGESEGTPLMEPLVTAKWSQEAPFNMYCPSNSDLGQSIVGCVATAMAQIMYKWKWPETGKGYINYTNSYGNTIVELSQSTYNWSIMKDKYSTLDAKKETGKAVAKLSYDCGVSVFMDYGSYGSGTHSQYVLQALYKNFSYKASTLDYRYRECCNNTKEFYNTIISELTKGRPVLFSAVSSTGTGADAGGHAFVVDGYDSADFLHVNWGWTGKANGYYDIDVMDAINYSFNVDQEIIFGIEPDYDGTDDKTGQYRLYMQKAPTVDFNSIALGKDFVVKLCNFYNYFPFSNVFYLGIGLYDYNGNLQEIVSDTPREYLTAWSGYAEYGLKCNIQKKYDNADYMLRFISRMDGYDDWKLVDIEGGSNLNVIPVVIKNGKVYFNQYTTAINDIKSDEHIVRTDYFTLNGQTVTDIDKFRGIVIEKRIYADGTVKTVKRVDRTR